MEEQSPIEHRRSTRLYVYDVVSSDLTRAMAPMQNGSLSARRPMKPRKADLPRPVASACARVRETRSLCRAEPHRTRARHGGDRHIVFYRTIAIARHMNDTLPSGAHFGGTRLVEATEFSTCQSARGTRRVLRCPQSSLLWSAGAAWRVVHTADVIARTASRARLHFCPRSIATTARAVHGAHRARAMAFRSAGSPARGGAT